MRRADGLQRRAQGLFIRHALLSVGKAPCLHESADRRVKAAVRLAAEAYAFAQQRNQLVGADGRAVLIERRERAAARDGEGGVEPVDLLHGGGEIIPRAPYAGTHQRIHCKKSSETGSDAPLQPVKSSGRSRSRQKSRFMAASQFKIGRFFKNIIAKTEKIANSI